MQITPFFCVEQDRKKNPLVAIAAGPDAGKTRFIDVCMTLGQVEEEEESRRGVEYHTVGPKDI